MDVKGGGCCVARYAGNAYADNMSRMDRIMLRFRPIAPKPASDGSASGSLSAEKIGECAKKTTGRGKRRYVRNNRKKNDSSSSGSKNNCRSKNGKKLKSSSSEENDSKISGGERDAVITLPLLPETPEREDYRSPGFNMGGDFWMGGVVGSTVAQRTRVVESWVHVECMTEAWVDGFGYGYGGIGWSDPGMLMDLERDAYPGFVSEGVERVVWVNRAYREMTAGREEEEVVVGLVIKEGFQLPPSGAGFTCSLRVVTWGEERISTSRTLPCDVWGLEGGRGFAWRLDVKSALSLGR